MNPKQVPDLPKRLHYNMPLENPREGAMKKAQHARSMPGLDSKLK